MALTHGGGYAEFCRVNEAHCLPVPPRLSLIEAAAVPETFFTVWYNVFMRCELTGGETFLVHGGSSGIGTTAIQLAKAHGCTVITTAGSKDKCRFCEDLGADRAINYRTGDWQRQVRDFTDGRGVDVLLDMVAGPYMQKNLDSMAIGGRYCIIAFLQGSSAELDMRVLLGRRLTITGSTLRPQSPAEKALIGPPSRSPAGRCWRTCATAARWPASCRWTSPKKLRRSFVTSRPRAKASPAARPARTA